MIINLSEVVFENDMFSFGLPDGSTLVMNKIDESLLTEEGESAVINQVNIEIVNEDGSFTKCPCIIGIDGNETKLNTVYTQYLGKLLNAENIKYCTLEYYERQTSE